MCKNALNHRVVLITNRLSPVCSALLNAENILLSGILECYIEYPGHELKAFAEHAGIPLLSQKKFSDESLAFFRCIHPEIAAVFSLHQILPESIYSFPEKGSINLHPSLLPAYRGPDPWFWQYYDGVKNGGFTVHQITGKADCGNILLQQSFPLDYQVPQTVFSEKMLKRIGAPLLVRAITEYDHIEPIPQPAQSATRYARNIFDCHGDSELNAASISKRKYLKLLYPDMDF